MLLFLPNKPKEWVERNMNKVPHYFCNIASLDISNIWKIYL